MLLWLPSYLAPAPGKGVPRWMIEAQSLHACISTPSLRAGASQVTVAGM